MIKLAVIILIIILVLSFFGFDLRSHVEAPVTQTNLQYVWGGVKFVWNDYLSRPLSYFWNNIFVGILWNSFMHNLGRINSNAPTELESATQRFLDIGNQPYMPIGE